jgi:hypothetical protein
MEISFFLFYPRGILVDSRFRGNDVNAGLFLMGFWIPAFAGMTVMLLDVAVFSLLLLALLSLLAMPSCFLFHPC